MVKQETCIHAEIKIIILINDNYLQIYITYM